MNKIAVNRPNFFDDNGEIITEAEHRRLYLEFLRDVEETYNSIANEIVFRINRTATSDEQKLRLLFDYLTSEEMVYDMQSTTADGRRATHLGYPFKNYKSWKIHQNTKYPILLVKKGVCETYSYAFEDLANKLGIPCRRISGFTGMDHAWNVVLINNQVKHIDVAHAISYRRISNKEYYFLKDNFTDRRITDSVSDLERDMRAQYNKEHSRIVINSRNGSQINSEIPTITINSRHDSQNTEAPKIKIFRRPRITILPKKSEE